MAIKRNPFIPHLALPNNQALSLLEQQLASKVDQIEQWFASHWRTLEPVWHSSVDLRCNQHRIAAVDTNLFPAGFNNLNPAFYPTCRQALQQTLQRYQLHAKKVLLIPEDHTRNDFYLQSLMVLNHCLNDAGYETRIASINHSENQTIPLKDGRSFQLAATQRINDQLQIEGWQPDLILLNNDLSAGIPEALSGLKQAIYPHPQLGWATRLKSDHFQQYQTVCEDFAEHFELDPWQLSPFFRNCGEIDFMKKTGQDCVRYNVDLLLQQIKHQYKKYHIDKPPFVFVKADSGTYGMGVMVIRDVSEVDTLNRKQRSHMAKSKDNQRINRVIIQEGIYSDVTWPSEAGNGLQHTAEPVMYLFGQTVVGAFYRAHQARGEDENLNSPGMYFKQLNYLADHDESVQSQNAHQRFYAYSVVARLAALAASRENQAITAPTKTTLNKA